MLPAGQPEPTLEFAFAADRFRQGYSRPHKTIGHMLPDWLPKAGRSLIFLSIIELNSGFAEGRLARIGRRPTFTPPRAPAEFRGRLTTSFGSQNSRSRYFK